MDSGDNHEWCARLYERRGAALLLYARSLGLSHAEAEDVLQETFRALLQSETPPDQEDRYVIRAVRNRALNHRRSMLRRIRREFHSEGWFEAKPDFSDREEAAMQRLAALPRKQREVIVLKIWHHHTFETIGELLGVSPNTVAARYRYGLQKLKAALQEEDQENERQGITRDRSVSGEMDTETPLCRAMQPGFRGPAQAGLAP